MNPHHNTNQNPASASAVQQVNHPVFNQQMLNGGLLMPAPFCYPFQLPVNQFNPVAQQQGQLFAMNPTAYHQNMGLPGQQLQNIWQLQCPPPMFQFGQNMGPFVPVQLQPPQNHHATLNNYIQGNHKSMPTNVNGGWIKSQHKNFAGHKTSKSHKHKFGTNKGNLSKEGGNNLAADSVSLNSTNFEKKVPRVSYSEQEIKEWREDRKKNYPTSGTLSKKHKKEQTTSDVTNQEAMLRRQELKEILAKQAELGCEVADIPASYISAPGEKKRDYKKGKFRGTSFQARMDRPRGQKTNHQTKREPSLLQKLLTQDVKRDKNRLLQVLRFITGNSFLTGESLQFPSVIVRETNVDELATCSLYNAEGEIID